MTSRLMSPSTTPMPRATSPARLAADLVPVAVRAVQHVARPTLTQTGNVGYLVAEPGGDNHPSGCDPMTALEQRPEPGAAVGNQLGDSAFEDVPAVAGDLFTAADQQVTGWKAVTEEVPVHVGGRCVTGLAGVDHEDSASGAGQRSSWQLAWVGSVRRAAELSAWPVGGENGVTHGVEPVSGPVE
jgi:hypothetical protein